MGRRAGPALIMTLPALVLTAGGAARSMAPAVPPAGIVSLDLRTHRQHLYPASGELAALSPEGNRIAFVTSRGNVERQLHIQRLDGSHDQVIVRAAAPIFMGYPRWSPDGRTIAYVRFDPTCVSGPPSCHGATQLWLTPSAGGEPRFLSDDAGEAAWAPDSRRLAFPGELDGGGRAKLTVEREDGSTRDAFGGRTSVHSLSWNAGGRRVGYSTNSPSFNERGPGAIHAVALATGADSVLAKGVDPAWSHDGKLLSFVRRVKGRTSLYLLGHGRRRALRGGYGFTFAHAWSRRGHRLAFAATNRFGQFRIYLYDADESARPRPLTSLRYGPVVGLVWSPNGRKLLFERTAG